MVSSSAAPAADPAENVLSSDVITKYRTAAEIANDVLAAVCAAITPGARVADVCKLGDDMITARTDAIYKKKSVEKGIAFPVCLNINSCAANFTPPADDSAVFAAGDVVKIELGVHVDGYIATSAHTTVVGPVTAENEKAARVIIATQKALDAAARMVRVGERASDLVKTIHAIAAAYDCRVIDNTMSGEMKRNLLEADKLIPLSLARKTDDVTFCKDEVYSINVLMTTAPEGKLKESDNIYLYQRNLDKFYNLKLKQSRAFYNEVCSKHPVFPFSTRQMPKTTGIRECVSHQLLLGYPVFLGTSPGEYIAQSKATILLNPSGPLRVTCNPELPAGLKTDKSVSDPEIIKILESDLKAMAIKPAPVKA